jgi:hypothetical protein
VRSTGSTEGNTTGLCKEQLRVDSRSLTAAAVGVDSSQMTATAGVDCTSPAAADDTLEAFDEATSLQPGPACTGDRWAPTQQQQQQQPWQQCHMHKYSVVWHDIYRVPVLYLAACRAGGWELGVGGYTVASRAYETFPSATRVNLHAWAASMQEAHSCRTGHATSADQQ